MTALTLYRPRSDAFPEGLQARSDCGHYGACGCEGVTGCCFQCPLPRCRYDGGPSQAVNALRDGQIATLRQGGASIDALAATFSLGRPSIFRVLRVARANGYRLPPARANGHGPPLGPAPRPGPPRPEPRPEPRPLPPTVGLRQDTPARPPATPNRRRKRAPGVPTAALGVVEGPDRPGLPSVVPRPGTEELDLRAIVRTSPANGNGNARI